MSTFSTDQEAFWAGQFGADYIQRNCGEKYVFRNLAFFSKVLRHALHIKSVLEFGANIGLNLIALRQLLPDVKLSAIEINDDAVRELKTVVDEVFHQSILEFKENNTWDFVLSKTVLIHINPDALSNVYDKLYRASRRYICIAEYYSPQPVEINYRGHRERLFKRDFAGELMDRFSDLELVDYGFTYHRDNLFPQDDLNWFLLKKR